MHTLIKLILVVTLSFYTSYAQEENPDITLTVTHIKSDTGMLYAAVYDSEENWLEKRYKSAMSTITDGKVTVTFSGIPEGTYAISVFHDTNDNKKLDTNFFGIPKEDTGCSNNAKGFMSAPSWEDATFKVGQESLELTIRM